VPRACSRVFCRDSDERRSGFLVHLKRTQKSRSNSQLLGLTPTVLSQEVMGSAKTSCSREAAVEEVKPHPVAV